MTSQLQLELDIAARLWIVRTPLAHFYLQFALDVTNHLGLKVAELLLLQRALVVLIEELKGNGRVPVREF